MSGISAKLPLARDDVDGVTLNKTIAEAMRQNLLNLFLTNPGERIMIPDFGIGLRRYLFEIDQPGMRSEIMGKAREQVSIYLPQIELLDMTFLTQQDDPNIRDNFMSIRVEFQIPALGIVENLDISVDMNDVSFSFD